MKLRRNEFCPVHRSIFCCGREPFRKERRVRLVGSTLSVFVPIDATSGPVTVQVGNITSNNINFTVEAPPAITDITPIKGQPGSWPVTITGSGFGPVRSNSSVQFYGDVPAEIISWSNTEIQAVVPDGTSTGPISVQVGGLKAEGPVFYINSIVHLTDSLGHESDYTSAINGGGWVLTDTQGPGCSTCSTRGDVQNVSDADGNVVSTTDALGHTTTYTYDSNNLASVSKPLDASTNATTSYTYNSFAEVLTVTDALGHTTTDLIP